MGLFKCGLLYLSLWVSVLVFFSVMTSSFPFSLFIFRMPTNGILDLFESLYLLYYLHILSLNFKFWAFFLQFLKILFGQRNFLVVF